MKISTLSKNLVLHLPLDQESYNPTTHRFTDKSAYGNHGIGHGTQLGGSPMFVTDWMGQLLRAAPFNGVNDYIDVPLIALGGDFTIAFWAKPNANTNYQVIFDDAGEHYSKGGIGVVNGKWALRETSAGGSTVLNSSSFNVSYWQHLIFTLEGTIAKVYFNDVLENTNPSFDHINQIDQIGTGSGSGEIKYNGILCDVIAYTRALSTPERTLLYNSYRPGVRI